jgi:BirA family transcriptional regulator, biotin operon repressor / biotin---[acetyl-CoA-carboxylase] ligase
MKIKMTTTGSSNPKRLDAEMINAQIKVDCAYQLFVLESIGSTNDFLRSNVGPITLEICCAEEQTAGRGSKGRSWSSPFGQNIYCSMKYSLPKAQDLSGLSLVVSLAVVATIHSVTSSRAQLTSSRAQLTSSRAQLTSSRGFSAGSMDPAHKARDDGVADGAVTRYDLQVKWPNDVLWQGLKLCGNLLEVQNNQLIIGIGLNVHEQMAEKHSWCSLADISSQDFDRNIIIAKLVSTVYSYIQKFLIFGFSAFLAEWQERDYLVGKNVHVKLNDEKDLDGRVIGVSTQGGLKILDASGVEHLVFSYSSLTVN